MKVRVLTAFLALSAASLLAQAPAATPTPLVHTNDLGFSYSLPSDWEILDMAPVTPAVQQQETKTATSESEKKGIACSQFALTARHGTPASVIVVVALPFACFGQKMTAKDLPSIAEGASEGIKKKFDISGPVYSAYTLGTHNLWIERGHGTMKDNPEVKRSVETVCGVVKKGLVCWISMATDDDALQIFEHGAVTMDGEASAALVPSDVFAKKPKQ
jgi:hypothetical protein